MEPSASAHSCEENVSGEGLDLLAHKLRAATTRAAARVRARATSFRRDPEAEEKDARRRQKALDREVAKAERAAEQCWQESPSPVGGAYSSRPFQPQPLQPPSEVLQSPSLTPQSSTPVGAREQLDLPQLPMVSNLPPLESPWGEPAPKRAKPNPEATFTPSATGLGSWETRAKNLAKRLRSLTKAISYSIVQYVQQNLPAASWAPDNTLHLGQPTAPNNPRDSSVFHSAHSPASSISSSGESLWDDEECKELMLSEDEGEAPERPNVPRLFRPASSIQTPESFSNDEEYKELMLSEDQGEAPKRPVMTRLFQTASSIQTPESFSNDEENKELILSEDEGSCLRTKAPHPSDMTGLFQFASSTPNPEFCLDDDEQEPVTDLRTHQNINKPVAVPELCADATVNLAKFTSRPIASSLTAQQVALYGPTDMNCKWKFACPPFKDDNLFGEARATVDPTNLLELEQWALKQENYSDGVIRTMQAARSPSTKRIYNVTWKTFCTWCSKAFIDPLSLSVAQILEFLQAGLDKGLSPKTIHRQVGALSTVLSCGKQESLAQHPIVRHFLRGATNLYSPTERQYPTQ